MNIQRNNLLFLLAALLYSPLVNLLPAAENTESLTKTLTFPEKRGNVLKVFNIVEGGSADAQKEDSIPLDLNQECPISKFSFFEHFKMFPTLIVAAVETEGGNMRFYNGVSISSWLLDDTFRAPKHNNLIDPLDQSRITCITYFLLTSLEKDFQFLCTLDDLTANENDVKHRYYRHLLKATGGYVLDQTNLGILYVHCWQELNLGSQEDGIQHALPYFQAATKQGEEGARHNLVLLYETHWKTLGICSQKKALEQICRIDLAAASQGNLNAQYQLGNIYKCYWQILDLTQQESMELSLIYYLLAAQNNHAISFCDQSTVQFAQLNVIYLSEDLTAQHQSWFDNLEECVLESYAALYSEQYEAIESKIGNFV